MTTMPSTSKDAPGGGARDPGGKAGQDDPRMPGTTGTGGMEGDPVEGASDPWAEGDAGHPDETSEDPLDQHPQPEDEAPGTPAA